MEVKKYLPENKLWYNDLVTMVYVKMANVCFIKIAENYISNQKNEK